MIVKDVMESYLQRMDDREGCNGRLFVRKDARKGCHGNKTEEGGTLSQIVWRQIKLYNMAYSRKYSNDMFYDNHYQFVSVHRPTTVHLLYLNIFHYRCLI